MGVSVWWAVGTVTTGGGTASGISGTWTTIGGGIAVLEVNVGVPPTGVFVISTLFGVSGPFFLLPLLCSRKGDG